MTNNSQMNIKRQPFGSAVRMGTWLHLGLVAFLLFQLFFPGGSFSLVMSLGLTVDWIVGSLYSRHYVKTWPVQIFNVAMGGMFADLFARCAGALVLGIFYYYANLAGSGASLAAGLQRALATAGDYVLWGALFAAVGAGYSLLYNKGIITAPQSLMLFIVVAGLWIAQYTYDTMFTDLRMGFAAALNWAIAGLAALVAVYIPNKTDGVSWRELGQALVLTLIGFFASLVYSAGPNGGSLAAHGFPFAISFDGWQRLTILMNLLFWFNISFMLTCIRTIFTFWSYSRE